VALSKFVSWAFVVWIGVAAPCAEASAQEPTVSSISTSTVAGDDRP
jgi:hypothetical protein